MNLLQKIFDNLEVKYGEDFNKGYNITINVEPNTCNCSNTQNCCNDENCHCNCHYEDFDEDDLDELDEEFEEVVQTPVTTIEMGNLDPIVAKNAVTASALRMRNFEFDEENSEEPEEVEEEPVKLINVNKNVSKVLEIVYDVINEVNDDGDTFVEFDLVEEFPELFKNVRDVTMDKVLARITRHLTENGFDVTSHTETNEYDNKVEKSYRVEVEW